MPYIKVENRRIFDESINVLSNFITHKGDLNYIICELVGQLILSTKISYTQM